VALWRANSTVVRERRVACLRAKWYHVGEGVAASNLAGRTVADLILERNTELVGLPWVGKPFPNWEPEPFRWAGVKAITSLAESVDASELKNGKRPKLRSRVLDRFMG